MSIESRKFSNDLTLYGANNIIENQNGYSFNAVTQTTLTDWPENFVVIADDGGDPFCIDINAIKDGDAPVYTSMHGEGIWKFEKFADSFENFIITLAG